MVLVIKFEPLASLRLNLTHRNKPISINQSEHPLHAIIANKRILPFRKQDYYIF